MMNTTAVKPAFCAVIPIYTLGLNREERLALEHNISLLGEACCTFIYPEDLDIAPLHKAYPGVGLQPVSNLWLGKRGIKGYNEMMMSKRFYSLFAGYEYIFICHYDAWLFKNEVGQWCEQGYDLVAAPWPTRPRYTRFPLKQYLRLKLWLKPKGKVLHCQMFGRIGNGGLCLRKVSTFLKACDDYKDEIDSYNRRADVMHNEDIFWALVPQGFNLPTVEQAMRFSFDLKPELLYRLNGGRLPMACHGFNKPVRRRFWQRFIPALS